MNVKWSEWMGLLLLPRLGGCWQSKLGLVPRLKIHKPAIGTGGSALVFRRHYSGGEVAVKIPRPEGYEGSRCHIVFGVVDR